MVIDTGASTCATPFKSDFIGPIEYGEGKDCIKILPIPTQDQRADIFTKALTKALFESFRKLLMGW